MNINRNNYESYLALYLERKLDPMKTAELMVFLSENPDIEKFYNMSLCLKLQPDDISFANKDVLKKNFADVAEINDQNFDEFCIASLENLLDPHDESRLHAYIMQHPEKEKSAYIYKHLKVNADLRVHFPDKSALKKPQSVIIAHRIVLMAISIAASVALMLWIITGKPETMEPPEKYSLQNTSPAITDQNTIPDIQSPEKYSSAVDDTYAENPVNNTQELVSDFMSEPDLKITETYRLSPLSPIPAHKLEIQPNTEEIALTSDHDLFNVMYDHPDDYLQNAGENEFAGNNLFNLIRELDAWETARIAVKGLNFLTESRLSIEKSTDDQGKIKEFIIDTEGLTLLTTKSK